jgi:hypothetical protein
MRPSLSKFCRLPSTKAFRNFGGSRPVTILEADGSVECIHHIRIRVKVASNGNGIMLPLSNKPSEPQTPP